MPTPNKQPNPGMIATLREVADDSGRLDYATFVATALYAPEVGYYAANRSRVGRNPDADFYTAQSLGSVFGRLVVAACENLLEQDALREHAFVEIGAEPGHSILQEVSHSFSEIKTIRLGDDLVIPDKAIVFSNEWLDAQPFRRFRFDQKRGWIERGVEITGEELREIDLTESGATLPSPERLLLEAPHDYLLDLPTGADAALRSLVTQSWNGLFLTLDYGLSFRQFIEERPEGVARSYRNHRLSGDLLARPGDQDLTCHVCWDTLEETLRKNGFEDTGVERQEAFFLRYAPSAAEAIATAKPETFDPERQTLMELLHPSNMGAKFQALRGIRKEAS